MDRPENPALENYCYATYLGNFDSPRKATRVLNEIGQAEGDSYKTNKHMWLNQVEDKWDKILFEQALTWEGSAIPEEAKNKFFEAKEGAGLGGKMWISLLGNEA